MAAVYVNNLIINAGADFSQTFTLEGSFSNTGIDLTNYTVTSQLRKWGGSSSYVEFSCSRIAPFTSGKILINLGSAQTAMIKPGRYVYDVVITDNLGIKSRVIEGMVLVTEGVTR
jgi:hypothetical protein